MAKPRLLHFHAIMVDPAGGFWCLLGHFTSTQIDCIEETFHSAREPVPWISVIMGVTPS